jgi:hypothetical protein
MPLSKEEVIGREGTAGEHVIWADGREVVERGRINHEVWASSGFGKGPRSADRSNPLALPFSFGKYGLQRREPCFPFVAFRKPKAIGCPVQRLVEALDSQAHILVLVGPAQILGAQLKWIARKRRRRRPLCQVGRRTADNGTDAQLQEITPGK